MSIADLPLIRPNPPKLTAMTEELRAIERSGVFTNNGPVVRRLEAEATGTLFGGEGGVVCTASATLGLMLAIKLATDSLPPRRRLALMPSFTFAAAGQAALWAGCKPLLCDIETSHWTACGAAEETLLKRYGQRVGVIVPYATFGAALDLERYEYLARKYELEVVVDAASSLGSTLPDGRNFGAGSRCTIVYSMHATKMFASGEGGLVYGPDRQKLEALRAMANFGFGASRSAVLPGLNAKLSEISALLALGKLREIASVAAHRTHLAGLYREELAGFGLQAPSPGTQAMQFMPVLLPPRLARHRPAIIARLAAQGVGAGAYFSPHLAEQPYFLTRVIAGDLRRTRDIAGRVIALPLTDAMEEADVRRVVVSLRQACGMTPAEAAHDSRPSSDSAAADSAATETGIETSEDAPWGQPHHPASPGHAAASPRFGAAS